MSDGIVFNIQRFSVHDGPGIRTTVFLKGCPLRCGWCHNPESQSPEPEIAVLEGRCIRCGSCREACPARGADGGNGGPAAADGRCTRCGACVDACPAGARRMVGRRATVDEVMAEVARDLPFFEESGGGATFSGGEPLQQPGFLGALLEACRARGIRTAVDTAGCAPRERLLGLAPLVDLFLYDVKHADDARHREGTGVPAGPIVENLRALAGAGAAVWLRVPVVPGWNDGAAELDAIARLAASVHGVRRVHLLPCHGLGRHKGAGRAAAPRPADRAPSAPADLEAAAGRFRALGLDARIGG
jgi:pyruvate formate lyase activating enzyme